jgi:hypothetical protein
MIRVCEFEMDGYDEPFRLASMSSAEAQKHIEEGREMLKRQATGEVPDEEWSLRARATIANALNKAMENGDNKPRIWSAKKIHEEMDIPTINALFLKTLEFSGLKAGEVTAASASPKSMAA